MHKDLIKAMTLIAGILMLGGCGAVFETSYDDVVTKEMSRKWRVVRTQVIVPDSLVVAEENELSPKGDIVWREDLYGDRRKQVAGIVRSGIMRGSAGLAGRKRVVLRATLREFHALSEKARINLVASGVHNVAFVLQVFDARTGRALTRPDLIRADLPALVGDAALAAQKKKWTQRARITAHIARVTSGWLGQGPDPRRKFFRPGA